DHPTRFGPDGAPEGEAQTIVLPFSKERLWSVVVIDEGPVEPAVGHFKYHWMIDHEPFRQWAEARGVAADQLTAPELVRLMTRLRGDRWRRLQVGPGGSGDETGGTLLDSPGAERADVLLGLAAFAADDARPLLPPDLYAGLPVALKMLGARLGDGTPA